MKKTILYVVALILGLASPLLASDLTQPQSTLYPYRSTIAVQDDFISGVTTNGSIGDLGWGRSGGATTGQAGETNRLGIFRMATSAVINTIASLFLNGSTVLNVDPALPTSLVWAVRLNTNDANTTARIGLGNTFITGNPPADGIYFEKLDADTNWFCVTRAAATETRTDSTVAVTTNFTTFSYTRNSSGVQFAIGNVNVCGLLTTNIPTVFSNPGLQIVNSAAADKTIDFDYFEMNISGLTR